MPGLEIYKVIVSDIGIQRVEGRVKEGDMKAASEEASSHKLTPEQTTKAVLKGMKYLMENGRDTDVVEAAVAFRLTEQQLVADLDMPEKLLEEVRVAMSAKRPDLGVDQIS